MQQSEFIIGIDEAGRGPVAGPVYVGAVLAPRDFNFGQFPGLTDSKQMTTTQREAVYKLAAERIETTELAAEVAYTQAASIDKHGIQTAIQHALNRSLRRLKVNPAVVEVYLDGGLSAPATYQQQTTVIGGDAKIPIISLASVMAKVRRDRHMQKLGVQYPHFHLAQHKGYGTAAHRQAIQTHGPSEIHRRSFLGNIYPPSKEKEIE